MVLPLISMCVVSAAICMQLFLTFQVIKRRRAEQTAVGDAPSTDLQRAIRAHGNFTEVTPIFLIMLVLLEMVDSYLWWVSGLGVVFLLGRALHARSILVDEVQDPPVFKKRVAGMMLTLISLALAALSGPVFIAWSVFGQ